MMKAIAPAKLILSGEHAVVYGAPALAMAIDRNAQTVLRQKGPVDSVSISLPDLHESGSYTLAALRAFRQRVSKNYRQFLEGQLGIRDVLMKPIDLFQFTFIIVLDGLHLKLTDPLDLVTQSNIPIGCGLGSSAATALSSLRAVGHYFRVEFRPDWYYEYSLEAEKLQHGHPSGVDSYISLHGGCALFQQGKAESVPLPRQPIRLLNTGTPGSTTGECVEQVRRDFADSAIWSEFRDVTWLMRDAIVADDNEKLIDAMRANHRLLDRIGVVPVPVSAFVAQVEARGGAAKLCGSGGVRGAGGGMLMVQAEESIDDLCREFGYETMIVRGDPLGARIV